MYMKTLKKIFLSPKCYFAERDDGETKMGTKGTPGHTVSFEMFHSTLYENANYTTEITSIQRKRARLVKSVTTKKQINPLLSDKYVYESFKSLFIILKHLKFRLAEDNITCLPLIKNNQIL